MPRRSRRYPAVTSTEIEALLIKADRLFAEGAKVQKRARKSLAEHFKQELADRPCAEDSARRDRMAKRTKKR